MITTLPVVGNAVSGASRRRLYRHSKHGYDKAAGGLRQRHPAGQRTNRVHHAAIAALAFAGHLLLSLVAVVPSSPFLLAFPPRLVPCDPGGGEAGHTSSSSAWYAYPSCVRLRSLTRNGRL